MKHRIVLFEPGSDYPWYITEIHVGYSKNPFSPIASFSFNKSTYKLDALQFETMEDLRIVFDFVNAYCKKFHKAYKLVIEEI